MKVAIVNLRVLLCVFGALLFDCSTVSQVHCPDIINTSSKVSLVNLEEICQRLDSLKGQDLALYFYVTDELPHPLERVNERDLMFANDPGIKNKAIVFISAVSKDCDIYYSLELKGRDLVRARHNLLEYVYRGLKNGIDSDLIQRIILQFDKQFLGSN